MDVRKGIWKRVRKGGLERGFGSGYGRWVWKGVKKGGPKGGSEEGPEGRFGRGVWRGLWYSKLAFFRLFCKLTSATHGKGRVADVGDIIT